METKNRQKDQGAQGGSVDKSTFFDPWIPIIPESGEGPHLDEEWEGNDYGIHAIR